MERSALRMKTSLTVPVRKWNLEGTLVSKQVSRQVSEQRLQPQTQRRSLDQRPWKNSGPRARRRVQTGVTCDPGVDDPPETLPSLQEVGPVGRSPPTPMLGALARSPISPLPWLPHLHTPELLGEFLKPHFPTRLRLEFLP